MKARKEANCSARPAKKMCEPNWVKLGLLVARNSEPPAAYNRQ